MTILFAARPTVAPLDPVDPTRGLELTCSAVDSDGREWPAGTVLQVASHGANGYRYTVVRAKP